LCGDRTIINSSKSPSSITIRLTFVALGFCIAIAISLFYLAKHEDYAGWGWGPTYKYAVLYPLIIGTIFLLFYIAIQYFRKSKFIANIPKYMAIGAFQVMWVLPAYYFAYMWFQTHSDDMVAPAERKDFVENIAGENGCNVIYEWNEKTINWDDKLYELSCDIGKMAIECDFDKSIPCYLR
jgi:hypothetical protein